MLVPSKVYLTVSRGQQGGQGSAPTLERGTGEDTSITSFAYASLRFLKAPMWNIIQAMYVVPPKESSLGIGRMRILVDRIRPYRWTKPL